MGPASSAPTTDRLVRDGHQVTVLDALTAPVHRDGVPNYLTPAPTSSSGTSATATCSPTCSAGGCRLPLRGLPGLPPDFSRFTDVNVVSTSLIYEIAVAEGLDLQRVVVASSQSAMGEGLYRCSATGSRLPGCAPRRRSAAACGRSLSRLRRAARDAAHPRAVSNPQNAYGMSKYGEEMVALNLGRRYGIPTVALRYSIVQGPRQSVYNAYSGACRIFSLHYLLGSAPTLYEDGEMVRDYVNIHDVVDANLLVLDDPMSRRPGLQRRWRTPYTTREFAEIVQAHYGSDLPGRVTGQYRFGDTRHIFSDVSALEGLGGPRNGLRPSRSPSTPTG